MLVPRFADAPVMLLAGIRRTHAMNDMAHAIPEQWEQFRALHIPNAVPGRTFGAMGGHDAQNQTVDYLAALEVSTFDGLDRSLGRMRVPASRYAVFTHTGPAAGISASWSAAMHWLATNGAWEDAVTPCFELYDERWTGGAGTCEIWLPVRPSGTR